MRKYVAEMVGAFFLVFAGAGSIVADQYLSTVRVVASFGFVGIALAHGLALGIGIAAIMRISGGHANPAVSIAAFIARRLSGKDALGYVVAQLLGGAVAALLLKGLTPPEAHEAVGVGVPALGTGVAMLDGIALEVVLTFFLAFTIWGVAIDDRGPKAIAPLAIGLVVTFDILAGGAFTGAAMNPARWFGPALASGQWANALVWIAGPIIGALLGSLLYETLYLTDQPPSPTDAALTEEDLLEEDLEEELEKEPEVVEVPEPEPLPPAPREPAPGPPRESPPLAPPTPPPPPGERPWERPPERPTERPPERPPERPVDRPWERPPERPTERPPERPPERPVDRPWERPPERPSEPPRPEERE
ncbi:MAG: MIP/aquaporin family protein [Actinomycetota bacterium]